MLERYHGRIERGQLRRSRCAACALRRSIPNSRHLLQMLSTLQAASFGNPVPIPRSVGRKQPQSWVYMMHHDACVTQGGCVVGHHVVIPKTFPVRFWGLKQARPEQIQPVVS